MLTRQKDMYEAVREEALHSTPTSEAHSPNAQQLQDSHPSLDEPSDVDTNEAYQEAEVLEELQVGASLIPAEEESMYDDEHQLSPLEDADKDGNKSDAYAQDFEALVEFLSSADADGGGEDEIFERLAAKVVFIRTVILIDEASDHLVTERLHDCPKLARLSGATCSGRRGRSRAEVHDSASHVIRLRTFSR
jgi:hypothetical protein